MDVFIKLHAPYENLVSVLEAMWYAREHPFNSRNGRKLLAKWLVSVVERWWETSRRAGEPFGSAENALGLSDLLRVVVESGDFSAQGSTALDAEWADRLRVIRVRADEIVR
jgi:nuclear pore complex protein Nup155